MAGIVHSLEPREGRENAEVHQQARAIGRREQVARVSERIRLVRARTRVLSRRIAEMARQFRDDDLALQPKPDPSGGPGKESRLDWLSRLAKLHRSYCSACEEEIRLQAMLRRMGASPEVAPLPERASPESRSSAN